MKKVFLFLGIFLIGLFSAIAVSDKGDGTDKVARVTSENSTKNMTFGQCVSDSASAKNTCYATVKATRDSCKAAALNSTEDGAAKKCRQDYKKDLKQCKMGFKSGKTECKKIKHTFFDEAKAAFK